MLIPNGLDGEARNEDTKQASFAVAPQNSRGTSTAFEAPAGGDSSHPGHHNRVTHRLGDELQAVPSTVENGDGRDRQRIGRSPAPPEQRGVLMEEPRFEDEHPITQHEFARGLASRFACEGCKPTADTLPTRSYVDIGAVPDFERVVHGAPKRIDAQLKRRAPFAKGGFRTQFERSAVGRRSTPHGELLSPNPRALFEDSKTSRLDAIGLGEDWPIGGDEEHTRNANLSERPRNALHKTARRAGNRTTFNNPKAHQWQTMKIRKAALKAAQKGIDLKR